jgi:hypothetical protein
MFTLLTALHAKMEVRLKSFRMPSHAAVRGPTTQAVSVQLPSAGMEEHYQAVRAFAPNLGQEPSVWIISVSTEDPQSKTLPFVRVSTATLETYVKRLRLYHLEAAAAAVQARVRRLQLEVQTVQQQ